MEESYWGGKEQPYWHPGLNLTADLVVLRDGLKGKEVLLVRRGEDAPAEPGKWALPGGFVETKAPKGAPWQPDVETPFAAAFRETQEETGLDLHPFQSRAKEVGHFQGNQRDPRDNQEAWSQSAAFIVDVGNAPLPEPRGADDAAVAKWEPLDTLSLLPLAFDHDRIIAESLKVMGISPGNAGGRGPICGAFRHSSTLIQGPSFPGKFLSK